MADEKSWAGMPRKTLKIALPTVAALGAGGAIAVAAIPSADGTIHGCYATGTDDSGFPSGNLRIVDPSVHGCNGSEQAISWNQQGPPGAPGAKGDKGDQGNKGDQGDPGDGSAPKQQTSQVFLKLDGISGSSADKAHKNQIDVLSIAWGSFRTGSSGAGSGGGGASKAKFKDLRFTKVHDASSAKLFKASATGQHIKSAVFSVLKNGTQTINYNLSNVTVESFDSLDGIFGTEAESVTLAPERVEIVVHDGNTIFSSSFDVKNNKKPVINSFSFKTLTR